MDEKLGQFLIELSADISASYVATNHIPIDQLPSLISGIHKSLSEIGSGDSVSAPSRKEPAVNIKKSVTPDYIVCLEDGLKFKSIRRHILTKYGLSPAEYRSKWDLPNDYPMVAPAYSAMRSALAKKLGLGFDRLPNAKRATGRPGKKHQG